MTMPCCCPFHHPATIPQPSTCALRCCLFGPTTSTSHQLPLLRLAYTLSVPWMTFTRTWLHHNSTLCLTSKSSTNISRAAFSVVSFHHAARRYKQSSCDWHMKLRIMSIEDEVHLRCDAGAHLEALIGFSQWMVGQDIILMLEGSNGAGNGFRRKRLFQERGGPRCIWGTNNI